MAVGGAVPILVVLVADHQETVVVTHRREEALALADDLVLLAVQDVHRAVDLDPLLERIGDARVVLLGEATHGTSEYYRWRARISERLLLEIARTGQAIRTSGPRGGCTRPALRECGRSRPPIHRRLSKIS